MKYNGILCCCVLPLAHKWDTPTNHNRWSLQKNKKKRESRFQRIDRRTRPISCGGSNQREPPVLTDSPSPRASADTLFLPTSRAPEEQRQSRCNHSGGKSGGKWGIGGIGRYISPRSTLRCVYRIPSRPNMSESNRDELDQLSFAQRHGASLNEWGGYYRRGKQYGMEKKLAIAETSSRWSSA